MHLSPLGFAACQSKKCTNKASMHQQSKYAPTQPHTLHGLEPSKQQQSAAPPIYANVRIINEFIKNFFLLFVISRESAKFAYI